METFTFGGLLVRFLLALALVLATFNPSGVSYMHWFLHEFPTITALKVVVGIGLLIAWIVFVRATMQSIGIVGVTLMAVFFAALIWLFVSWGWIDIAHSQRALAWVLLVIVSLILTAGLSWAHVRRRLSGQATVDEIEER
jgi:hypothetical protein